MNKILSPLLREEIPQAALLMARAYIEDPIVEWIMGQATEDKKLYSFAAYFENFLRNSFSGAQILCVRSENNEVVAVAVYFYPGHYPPTQLERLKDLKFLLTNLPLSVGLRKTISYLRLEEKIYASYPKEKFYKAEIGCISKDFQHRGLGRQMNEHLFELADVEGLPVYGETSNPKNLPIWQSVGYEIVTTIEFEALNYWILLRRPRSS